MITVNCSTGKTVKLEELELYPQRLKKHSLLEIDRVENSIKDKGLCFPITIGKVDGHTYIIDGEATYLALKQMDSSEVPEIPVVLVRCNEETIKEMILISASTNHCTNETSLKHFIENTDLDLKNYGFPTYELIDFHTDVDIGLYVETIGGKFSEQKLNHEDFEGLLK